MPPSGTLTVVVTVTKEKVGNCTVVPGAFGSRCCSRCCCWAWSGCLLRRGGAGCLRAGERERIHLADLAEEGDEVSRTNRRSLETTACTLRKVPSLRTTITGCCAAAKSPTTGMTLITNGRLGRVGDHRRLAVE